MLLVYFPRSQYISYKKPLYISLVFETVIKMGQWSIASQQNSPIPFSPLFFSNRLIEVTYELRTQAHLKRAVTWNGPQVSPSELYRHIHTIWPLG